MVKGFDLEWYRGFVKFRCNGDIYRNKYLRGPIGPLIIIIIISIIFEISIIIIFIFIFILFLFPFFLLLKLWLLYRIINITAVF